MLRESQELLMKMLLTLHLNSVKMAFMSVHSRTVVYRQIMAFFGFIIVRVPSLG